MEAEQNEPKEQQKTNTAEATTCCNYERLSMGLVISVFMAVGVKDNYGLIPVHGVLNGHSQDSKGGRY